MHKNWMIVNFDWLESKTYREIMISYKGIQLIYDILRRYVVRDNMEHKVSKYIYNTYYSKNILASAVPYTQLNKLTSMSNTTIKNCLNKLSEIGFIKIETTEGYTSDKQSVYILGKRKEYIDGNGFSDFIDNWLIDNVIAQEIYEAKKDKYL